MQTIPCDPTLVRYEMRCVLGDDGRAFWLQFRWNTRDAGWYMSVFDADRNPIAMSIRIVVGSFLMRRLASAARPSGVFLAVDTSGADLDPGIADLGARVQLKFLTPADAVALAAGS